MIRSAANVAAALAVALAAALCYPALAEEGADDYAAACASCHGDAEELKAGLSGETADDRAVALDAFLENHFAPDADTRGRIVAYLTSAG